MYLSSFLGCRLFNKRAILRIMLWHDQRIMRLRINPSLHRGGIFQDFRIRSGLFCHDGSTSAKNLSGPTNYRSSPKNY